MTFLFANSLIDGFLISNFIGKTIVLVQGATSIVMFSAIIGKWMELSAITKSCRKFHSAFSACNEVMDYYFSTRTSVTYGMEGIYKITCERFLTIMTPDVRSLVAGRNAGASAAMTAREIDLVRVSCEHYLDEQEVSIEKGMSGIATVVALSPMLGLLGTVWGVLDAFADMGTAGSANLMTIAPSISSALVTTVIGLLIAIPGVFAFNYLSGNIRTLCCKMEGFADELMGRIACEYQGRNA